MKHRDYKVPTWLTIVLGLLLLTGCVTAVVGAIKGISWLINHI